MINSNARLNPANLPELMRSSRELPHSFLYSGKEFGITSLCDWHETFTSSYDAFDPTIPRQQLVEAVKIHGDPPLDLTRKRFLGGPGQYLQIKEMPDYLHAREERAAIDNNIEFISRCFNDSTIVVLCAGNSENICHIVKKGGGRPTRFLLNEIVPDSLKNSFKNISRRLCFPSKDIIRIPGSILNDKIWHQHFKDASSLPNYKRGDDLLELSRGTPMTVVSLGVTLFNDFTIDQMKWLLKFFYDRFDPGTIFIVSVSFVCDPKILEKEYINFRSKQFVLTGGANACWSQNPMFDPRYITSDIRLDFDAAGAALIRPIIIDKRDKHEKPFVPIYKPPFTLLEAMIKYARMEIIEPKLVGNTPELNQFLLVLRHKGAAMRPRLGL